MRLDELQPSQLYISSAKLASILEGWPDSLVPVPVKRLGDHVVLTDGHTRAFAAFSHDLSEIRVFWDEDELDREAYEICVEWCRQAGIRTVANLGDRVVDPDEYEVLWLRRCARMRQDLEGGRSGREQGAAS